jgi:hypothetical protein
MIMLHKTLFLACAAILVVLVVSSEVQAWGAYHVGYTHVGPYGAYHVGGTEAYGGYGGARYGGVYARGYGGYGGAYRGGFYRRW